MYDGNTCKVKGADQKSDDDNALVDDERSPKFMLSEDSSFKCK